MTKSMKHTHLFLLFFLFFCQPVWADELVLSPQNPTNTDEIIATITGCRGHSQILVEEALVEFDSNEISIYAKIGGGDFAVGSCYEENVVIGTLAPGEYIIRFYVDDRTPSLQSELAITVTGPTAIPTMNLTGLLFLSLIVAWVVRLKIHQKRIM